MIEDDQPLKEVRTVWGQAEADIIRALLESHGVPTLFRGRVQQSIYPMTVDGMGELKIFVTEKDYAAAMAILADLPKPEDVEAFEKDGEEDT
jgi:hypothetical protein